MSILRSGHVSRKGHTDYLHQNNPPLESVVKGPVPTGALDLDPRAAVEEWTITAVGRRPHDYMGRDLLLNSLWRDERPRVLHNLAKKPPAWIQDHVQHLPGADRRQAAQLDVLNYLHRRQIARLMTGDLVDAVAGGDGTDLLAGVWRCWPYGAQMEPPGGAKTPLHGCWCRLAWLCPWCYARRAAALHRLLREGPLRQPRSKHLVMAWVSTLGEQASPDPAWTARWKSLAEAGSYHLQSPQKVHRVRQLVMGKLRRAARELGIGGGLIAHQISPWKTQDYRRGVEPGLLSFRHDYVLLGEITFSDHEQFEWLQEQTEYRADPFGAVNIRDPDLAECYQSPSIFWSCHPADDTNADTLRLFLAGSSTNYPVGRLAWYAGGLSQGRLVRNGVRGALALQPNFMMDEVQWWSYVEATRGLPLYVPFGSWRDGIGEAKQARVEARKTAVSLPSSGRKAVCRRTEGLKKSNAERKRQAREDLDTLVEVARPLFKQALAEQSGKRGRPAHRARLRTLLEQGGYSVSEHRLKQVVRELG